MTPFYNYTFYNWRLLKLEQRTDWESKHWYSFIENSFVTTSNFEHSVIISIYSEISTYAF